MNYSISKTDIVFTRNGRTARLPIKDSGVIQLTNNTFVPLGEWNIELGLKVQSLQKSLWNNELSLSDAERKNGFGLQEQFND
ncbi:hypothetical protein [Paenibacillus sp. FSL H8-0537]|uniref:hypothetical protein n=1 Tax=Paenibacillus sp. FSL H8-0537 TaxID=2921399 RepID=UPI003101951E